MASGSLLRQRSMSNRMEAPQLVLPKGKDAATEDPFEPAAATASHFLFAQGATVVVLHHDTLALERRFQSHTDKIEIISVDNVSERNSGRLVVTYDVGKTAIIWDLFSGQQVSRFASFEPILVAAWMRNGNIAFGNEKGDVILFEPSTSEHISARTIHDPITALAPSSDCKTYALGYRNGSILLAALQPQFTILHTLNTTRSPSPISMLTWHASSSKQKSDMLAIQNADGDLRVWSVPKPATAGIPRVIRILKRNETFVQGRNWVSWSKNGRIIQFSEGETWAWDVRTKDVNYVPIPTVEFVRGIAAHGATASLFTLGPDSTVQQYDVESGQMVANIRHMPVTVPPTPPEEYVRQFSSMNDHDSQSQLRPSRYEPEARSDPRDKANGHLQSAVSRISDKKQSMVDGLSPSRTEKSATTFSMGAYNNYAQNSARSQQVPTSPVGGPTRPAPRQTSRLRQEVVMSPMTPAEEVPGVIDLFPYARVRLSDALQRQVKPLDEHSATPDDLRKHMLNVVFGWEDDIYALIADELQRHPDDSLNALYLTKWLHTGSDVFTELMAGTPPDPQLDMARLALGLIDGRPESKKLGQVFVEKMLGKGEIHTAVAILLAMGDKNDAVEVYVTNNCYLESILLTCLTMPGDWQRQSHLVRKWGEHVVENSQQQLAIRCFACTGVEPAENWVSPTAQMYNQFGSPRSATLQLPPMMLPVAPSPQDYQHYQSPMYAQPPTLANPSVSRLKGRGFDAPTPVALIAPPTPFRTAAATGTRITPQTGGLKLITSFGAPGTKSFKFPGLKTEDMTPTNTNTTMVTPIAESAISRSALSPGGFGSYRMNNIQSLNNAMSRGAPLSAGPVAPRNRLPSIGETPHDVDSPRYPGRPVGRAPPTPADSGSDKEKERMAAARAVEAEKQDTRRDRPEPALTLLTSARYDPSSTPAPKDESDPEPQTALRPTTNNTWNQPLSRVQEGLSHGRNGSRSKRPEGLSLSVMSVKEEDEPVDMPNPLDRPNTTDTSITNFAMSPVPGSDIYRVKSPSISGRSIDQYISSLDQAQYYGQTRSRNSSRAPKEDKADRKRSKPSKQHYPEDTTERREISAPKRSPSSPVPMSPENLRDFTTSVESFDSMFYSSANASANDQSYHSASHRYRESTSTAEIGRARHRSRSTQETGRRKQSVKGSRRTSPAPEVDSSRRGRSKSRKAGSKARSPSSPVPMLPSEEDIEGRSSVDPAFRFVSKNRTRLARSTSRRPETDHGGRRESSTERRRGRQRSSSPDMDVGTPIAPRLNSVGFKDGRRKRRDTSEDLHRSERSQYDTIEKLDEMADMIRGNTASTSRHPKTKELAQAELEARRLSLARRPSVPAIPLPGKINSHVSSLSDGLEDATPIARYQPDFSSRAAQRAPSRQHEELSASQNGGFLQQDLNGQYDDAEDDLYQLPARTYSANTHHDSYETHAPADPPANMPRHPAFDHRVSTSRGNSRSRTRAASQDGRRGKSTDRARSQLESQQAIDEEQSAAEEPPAVVVGSPEMPYDYNGNRESVGPAILPELQHLAIPPPPPPAPLPPSRQGPSNDLKIQTDLAQIASIPLPKSAFPSMGDQDITPDKGHKRQSSRGESQGQGQFLGKFRGITDRMRSTSKPRDNYTRGPNFDEGILSPYETVTMMPPPLSAVHDRR